MTRADSSRHPASFRDPHGYIFESDGVLFRAVERAGEPDFLASVESGLYRELVGERLLVEHEDLGVQRLATGRDCRMLRPERVPIISYACEWTFSQLKAAALLTLDLHRRALRRGLSLRDASSFNVQFNGVRPIFIDTLSFARSASDLPWIAYRQFCEHFLAPLALIAAHGHGVAALWSGSVEGVRLDVASRLLPATSWLRPGLALHLHLHAAAGASGDARPVRARRERPRPGFGLRLVESLESAVRSLQLPAAERSVWTDYRTTSTYAADDTEAKSAFVRGCTAECRPSRAVDLGANDGFFTAVLAESGVPVTAIDADALSCESVFNGHGRTSSGTINTARIDLANPTPAFGWAGRERSCFLDRYRCDLVLALALVHHLAITKQIPFDRMANGLAALGRDLIVEYVPPGDPMVARLLLGAPPAASFGEEAFGEPAFLEAFGQRFDVLRRSDALAGGRVLFWMRRRATPA